MFVFSYHLIMFLMRNSALTCGVVSLSLKNFNSPSPRSLSIVATNLLLSLHRARHLSPTVYTLLLSSVLSSLGSSFTSLRSFKSSGCFSSVLGALVLVKGRSLGLLTLIHSSGLELIFKMLLFKFKLISSYI